MSDLHNRTARWIDGALDARSTGKLGPWLESVLSEIGGGLGDGEFAQKLSLASRFSPRGPLTPSKDERSAAHSLLQGFNPERWSLLDTVRVRLILERAQADAETLPAALEEAFQYADEGELRGLYRSLQFLPGPERFVWRSGEGCRTNMKTVFEANACDTAYPAAHFDDATWRQLCIKTLFVEAPLWRLSGLDDRVDSELARMALDLAEERRSAGRSVYPELWLCLGPEPTERALAAIEGELSGTDELSRKGAILALGRMGQTERLVEIEDLGGSLFGPIAQWALMGRHNQDAFASISPPEGAEPSTTSHVPSN